MKRELIYWPPSLEGACPAKGLTVGHFVAGKLVFDVAFHLVFFGDEFIQFFHGVQHEQARLLLAANFFVLLNSDDGSLNRLDGKFSGSANYRRVFDSGFLYHDHPFPDLLNQTRIQKTGQLLLGYSNSYIIPQATLEGNGIKLWLALNQPAAGRK